MSSTSWEFHTIKAEAKGFELVREISARYRWLLASDKLIHCLSDDGNGVRGVKLCKCEATSPKMTIKCSVSIYKGRPIPRRIKNNTWNCENYNSKNIIAESNKEKQQTLQCLVLINNIFLEGLTITTNSILIKFIWCTNLISDCLSSL